MEKEVFFGGGNMSTAIGGSGEVGCGMSHFKIILHGSCLKRLTGQV